MKLIFTSFLIMTSLFSVAQLTTTFEEQELNSESYVNDAGDSGEFTFGIVSFPNDYNSEWGSFTHWAVSNVTDNMTPGFGNQFSAITGEGHDSENYGVSYTPSSTVIRFSEPVELVNASVTNGTYPYFSMLDGDAFAKKFGGESGNDPDFFNLIIHSYLDGELSEDSIVVKLADYTFEDNSQDYILNSWLDVDLSVLGMADSLSFQLNSSDIGDFGMNTPAYFCLDNLVYSTINSVENQTDSKFIVYPNPANSQLFTRTPFDKVMAFNCLGEMVLEFSNEKEMAELDISSLSKGLYSFQFFRKDKFEIAQVIVN